MSDLFTSFIFFGSIGLLCFTYFIFNKHKDGIELILGASLLSLAASLVFLTSSFKLDTIKNFIIL